ncbi:Long chain acyl-CoA synthetase 7 peroxisomal [Stylosanthes scabra]|uniref:Long chain acyl-CoA synthetase 7 peroxisomal n=1 Tax=Stylosanthes scabra TaxID=79078 RepID=A0ABU6VPC7_9FABA|nr:Long chain acyl-CoA synthetase 7 peroxisomal [Stylosanthes scabra]
MSYPNPSCDLVSLPRPIAVRTPPHHPAGSLGQAAIILKFVTRAASSLLPGAPPPISSSVVSASSILTSRPSQLSLKLCTSQMAKEVELVDVPKMNYTSDDQPYPRGEMCVRGSIIFQGHYEDEAQTKEVIDEEGWFHNGDIWTWLPGASLKIIDR